MIQDLWPIAAQVRLDAQCQKQIEPLVAVAAIEAVWHVDVGGLRCGGQLIQRSGVRVEADVFLERVGIACTFGRRRL